MPLFNLDPESESKAARARSRMALAEASKFLGLMMTAVNEGWFASAHQFHVKALQSLADAAIYADGIRS